MIPFGWLQIAHYPDKLVLFRFKIVDALPVLLALLVIPVVALIKGVGEVDASIRPDPDIVGAVEKLAVVVLHDDGGLS